MEIRPYRSQVKSTPVISADQATPDLTKGAKLQVYGNVVEGAGKVGAQVYDAVEKQRLQNLAAASEAAQMDIDSAIANGMNEFNKYLEERGRNPSAVLYEDNKAADEVYSYQMQLARENTVGKITDPKLKQAAEQYFDQKKMAAGVLATQAVDAHKKNAAATTIGRGWDKAEENAIAATDEAVKNSYLVDISKYIGQLVDLGVISPGQREQAYKDAKNRINVGRAKNVIQASDMNTGREFINSISNTLDDKDRNALLDFYKDFWDGQKQAVQQQQGEAYNYHFDLIANGQGSREAINADQRFNMHPEMGLTTDWRKTLIGLMDAQDEASARDELKQAMEAADGEAQKAMREYMELISSGKATSKDAQRAAADMRLKPKDGQKTDYSVAVNRAFEYYFKWGDKDEGGAGVSGYGSGYVDSMDVMEIVNNRYATVPEKERQLMEWAEPYIRSGMLNMSDLNNINKVIKDTSYTIDPRVSAAFTKLDNYKASLTSLIRNGKAKPGDVERLDRLEAATSSIFRAMAQNQAIDDYTKREENLKRSLDNVNRILDGEDLAEVLTSSSISANNQPVLARNGRYSIYPDNQYKTLKANEGVYLDLRYADPDNIWASNFMDVETNILSRTVGGNPGDYEMMVSKDGNYIYYLSRDREHAYRIKDWTIEESHKIDNGTKNGKASAWAVLEAPERSTELGKPEINPAFPGFMPVINNVPEETIEENQAEFKRLQQGKSAIQR